MFGIWRSEQLVPHDCAGISNGLLSRYRWWGGGEEDGLNEYRPILILNPHDPIETVEYKGQTPLSSLAPATADITLALWKQQDIILDEVCYYMGNNHTGCFRDHTCIMYNGKKSKEFFYTLLQLLKAVDSICWPQIVQENIFIYIRCPKML